MAWQALRPGETPIFRSLCSPDRRKARHALACAGLACAAFLAAPAAAQDYPSRTIRFIVPFGAGGPTDMFTRALGEELRKTFNQPVIMENRPGAGSIIGTTEVARAAPDGYTLLMISATQTVVETLNANKSYVLMRDLVPVAAMMNSELVLVVPERSPVNSLKDLIALAKAKPGTLNYGSSGPGSNYHMAGELIKNLAGLDIVHVPYKGSTGARADIISGQIDMMFDSLPSMAPTIMAGRVRALGTSGKVRSPILPDVPTIAEAGIPGYDATIWIGVMAPAGTPREIVDKLNREINRVLERQDIKASWHRQGANTMVMTPAAFGAYIEAEIARWARLIKANNIGAN
jgi:tripartite-type tricarboxylate transporter receptor subunit TctC